MADSLDDREHDYEMSDIEFENVFIKENRGYVRFQNKKSGVFYLDPSPFLKTQKKEVFYAENCQTPPVDKLIEVTVRETEKVTITSGNPTEGYWPDHILIKYITDWQFIDPNKIRRNRNVSREDFLDFLMMPIEKDLYNEDLQYCLGLYHVASPQINEYQKGGINATVMGKFHTDDNWKKFKGITQIVPPRFRKIKSRNFYKNLEYNMPLELSACREVSLAYYNITDIYYDLPIAFNVEFKDPASYKDNYDFMFKMAQTYLLDTLLFNPEISEEYLKKFGNLLNEYAYDTASRYDVQFHENTPQTKIRLATAFARLDVKPEADIDNVNQGMDLLFNSTEHYSAAMKEAERYNSAAKKFENFFNFPANQKQVLSELGDMEDTGIPLTIKNLKEITKLKIEDLEETLKKLEKKGYIYFPNADTIGFIKSYKKL